jgi:hypothetical protein
MIQCYCAIFHFADGSGQVSGLSGSDAACVAINLALFLRKKRKIATGPKIGTNEDHNTHTKIL